MRVFLFVMVTVGLNAQTNAIPRSTSQNLIKRSFAKWTPKMALKPEVRQEFVKKPESGPSPCSVPLLNVTPMAKGTMTIVAPPKSESKLPHLKMPAPPCP
jgi:hypothetical protein